MSHCFARVFLFYQCDSKQTVPYLTCEYNWADLSQASIISIISFSNILLVFSSYCFCNVLIFFTPWLFYISITTLWLCCSHFLYWYTTEISMQSELFHWEVLRHTMQPCVRHFAVHHVPWLCFGAWAVTLGTTIAFKFLFSFNCWYLLISPQGPKA